LIAEFIRMQQFQIKLRRLTHSAATTAHTHVLMDMEMMMRTSLILAFAFD
jgi:hypothetical protein